MLTEVCRSISECLGAMQARNSVTKIGFITYDSAVHFYNLNSNLTAAQVLFSTLACDRCLLAHTVGALCAFLALF
jgi:hypothetical protein